MTKPTAKTAAKATAASRKPAAKTAKPTAKAAPKSATKSVAKPVAKAPAKPVAQPKPAPAKAAANTTAKPVVKAEPVKAAKASTKPEKLIAPQVPPVEPPPAPVAEESAASAKPLSAKAAKKLRDKQMLAALELSQPTMIDLEARRTRLKSLITLGKERGYLTYAEINDHLPDDIVDAEQIESIITTFSDMGIQVYDQAPAPKKCCWPNRVLRRSMPMKPRKRPNRRSTRSTPNSAARPTPCACTCARWERSSC
jgi:RNA polymerase primary sigma factor